MHDRSPGRLTSITGIIFMTTHGLVIDICSEIYPIHSRL